MFGAKRVDVGYFAQHQLDELNPPATPYDHMLKLMPEATEAQRRTRLGTYGFCADKADTKCAKLSGGEKARLLLALTAFHAPHLLILDEPTNHLDVDSREALIHALNEYDGAVILISHDRHLIEASADRLWVVRDGTVTPYDGDMDSYRAELLAERGAGPRGRARGARPRRRAAPAPISAALPPTGARPRAAEESHAEGGEVSRDAQRRYRAARRRSPIRSSTRRERRRARRSSAGSCQASERSRGGMADCPEAYEAANADAADAAEA